MPLLVFSQIMKERRVFYVDCSYSMVSPNKIWDSVRENLKNAIDNVNDENTELVIVPFAYDNKHHSDGLEAFIEKATESGKEILKKRIDDLPMSKNTMTYHSDPLSDFYYNDRVASNCITYMFFMTDGQNEENPNSFLPLLQEWGDRYEKKYVYGFYVMLSELAKDEMVCSVIEKQEHLWVVETADVNINLVRVDNHAIYNARNDEYFELPIYGNTSGLEIECSFLNDSPYSVRKSSLENGKIRVYVSYEDDVYSLPVSKDYELLLTVNKKGEFDFLVTNKVLVKCESKPERSLKISVK